MTHVSASEYAAIRRLAAAKKAKREQKAVELWGEKSKPQKEGKVRSLVSRKVLKDQIVHLLGLVDRTKFGAYCRLATHCPEFRKVGNHPGEVAYHIIPQMRGDAARFVPENVVWACHAANFGEVNNRSLYRDKHIAVFGKARVERLEEIARSTVKYSTAELIELRTNIKTELGAL